MVIALVVAVAVASLLAALAWFWRPETVIRNQVRKRCLVTLKDGSAFAGVLWMADRSVVVLRDATVAETGVSVDGEVLLHRADVAYIQLP